MSGQISLLDGPRPPWWTGRDGLLLREFYDNAKAPRADTERCRLCRFWLSSYGERGECQLKPRREEKPATGAGDTCGDWTPFQLS